MSRVHFSHIPPYSRPGNSLSLCIDFNQPIFPCKKIFHWVGQDPPPREKRYFLYLPSTVWKCSVRIELKKIKFHTE